MPEWYFDSVPRALQEHHLSALAGMQEANMIPDLALRFENTITLVHPRNEPGSLNAMLETLRKMEKKNKEELLGDLESTQIYAAKDNSLTLNIFRFVPRAASPDATRPSHVPEEIAQYVADLKRGAFEHEHTRHVSKSSKLLDDILIHVQRCKRDHLINLSPRRFLLQMSMVDQVLGSDRVASNVELDYACVPGDAMISLAVTDVAPVAAMSRVARYLGAMGIDIARVNLDVIQGVSVLKVLTTSYTDAKTGKTTNWASSGTSVGDLARVAKWIDDRVLDTLELNASRETGSSPSLLVAEATVALADLTHALLSPSDPYQYARSRVLHILTKDLNTAEGEIARETVMHFLHKFSPASSAFASAPSTYDFESMRSKIGVKVENPSSRALLEKLQEYVQGVKRTNLHLGDGRFALSMRLDASKCQPPAELMQGRETPYGLFFASGRRFTGLQLRFRDIARGGLRLVGPINSELFMLETSRQYFECYDLAYAQQLKNKDLAEGGAKAVCVIDTAGLDTVDRNRAMRRTVKAFVDSVLDLLPPNAPLPSCAEGSNELVYFGPDENIISQDIAWIANRALERKNPLGTAVISSKVRDGINHKHYGVTSEGVNVFMETALLEAGIDPRKQPFTVKITGFGDVGGNLLKILHREYGNNCRIVGISDATGCAEDPNGLQWPELLRLFEAGAPLSEMDPKRGLSTAGTGVLGLATEREGLLQRNTMHFRVKSDVFLPAGGRPATINVSNWKQFLGEDGRPSSPIIVEGANLFLTAPARKHLSLEAGCMIVKDSSANKCGVITSSYEVLGGMILDTERFVKVKEEYVEQVLHRLRYLAKLEANMLMREWRSGRAPVLPETCIALSHAMLGLADNMEILQQQSGEVDQDLLKFVARLLPVKPLVRTLLGRSEDPSEEEICAVMREKLPAAYLRGLISKVVASECVYREGMTYFGNDAARAVQYIKAIRTVENVAREVEPTSEFAAQLLRQSGARTLLELGKAQ